MAKIQINNPRQIINGGAKKYYFKVKGLGGPKGDKGDKGDPGSRGPQGEPGNAATVYVGSTTTLPVGYDATVENVGTQYNAVLNFGIPQGPRGPQGIQGERGEPGQTGQKGPRGPQGERGTNATVYVGTTTTTNPGTQARVYNSGTDSNAVLNFEIPRGDVGPQPELVQTTGTSTTKAMSQNATTVALATKQNTIDSSHKLSADLVDDTSTTNKFVTASDKATWNAKQNALTAGDNITISGDTISTPAIVPEVVAELPITGDEGKLYLTPKTYTTGTASGNPITVSLGEDEGAIDSFQLDGDTFQQSYEGKNLCRITLPNTSTVVYSDNTITLNGSRGTGNLQDTSNIGTRLVAGTYTIRAFLLSGSASGNGTRFIMRISNNVFTVRSDISGASEAFSVTLDSDADVKLQIWVDESTTYNNLKIGYQIEAGSTATSYEPYVGGQPSPNPDYPQPIQTVTGLQTISINGTDYPISLGSIELCKLGTYQDYIYKSGSDWKVHKAISTITVDGSEDWAYNGDNKFSAANISGMAMPINADALCYCATHIGVLSAQNGAEFAPLVADKPYATDVHKTLKTVRFKDIRFTTTAELQSWLSQNNTTIYYVVATPTDTTITDQTLIAQLEAIRTAALENGANTITNTATGSNLAGDMKIGYYGFDPRNRYDKWLWLDINNEYEQIGS